MPGAQRLAGGPQAVRAGFRQPVEPVEIVPVDLHAVADPLHPMLVIETAPIGAVEQLARDVRRVEQPGFLVLELVDAAAAAAVAQRLPLAMVEARQRLFPERRSTIHDKATHALLSGADQAGYPRLS